MVAPLVRATTGGAILNRQLRSQGSAPVNHKRTYRIMRAHNLLLARKYSERPEHSHAATARVSGETGPRAMSRSSTVPLAR